MRKVLIIYAIYLCAIWIYFPIFYPLETFGDTRYAAIAHAVFFSKLPLEWILLYAIIKQGFAEAWSDKIESFIKWRSIQAMIFSFLLVFLYGLIRFPFNLLWFRVTHSEGTSHQPFGDWLSEMGLDLFFYWMMLSIGIYVGQILITKFKRAWWFVAWLLALPIAVFVVYIQPVWIDPLYEDFTQMEAGQVRDAIEALTHRAGLDDATLLQVNMSDKVTTFNAYVNGIGDHARIVLWDTTLEGMELAEILFIVAHEIGHYVMYHVYLGVAGYLVLSLVLLYVASILYSRYMKLNNKHESLGDLRAIPILLLILSLLMTATQPISMYVSRQMEIASDKYAIENTEELEPAIDGYLRMARQSRTDIDPVFWVKWIRSSHPSILDRIKLVEKEIEKRETKELSSS